MKNNQLYPEQWFITNTHIITNTLLLFAACIKKRLPSVLLSLLALHGSGFAQEQGTSRFFGEVWIGPQAAVPMGNFATNADFLFGKGGNCGFVFSPFRGSNIFQTGLEIGVYYLGKEKKTVNNVPIKSTSSLFSANLICRFITPGQTKFRAYVDIIGGSKTFIVKTKFDNNLLNAALNLVDSTSFSSKETTLLGYGAGFGIRFRPESWKQGSHLDFRITYLASGSMEYVSPNGFTQSPSGSIFYEDYTVDRTDMIFPMITYVIMITGKGK